MAQRGRQLGFALLVKARTDASLRYRVHPESERNPTGGPGIGKNPGVGTLVPAEFPMSSLKNDAERIVVEALCDRLTDSWLVLPAIALSGDERDYEIDVVIAHEHDGIAVIEVKGHRPHIREGIWYAGSDPMQPQPLAQARDNAYALRNRIRKLHPSLSQTKVEYAVAFPNVSEVRGHLPTDTDADAGAHVSRSRGLSRCGRAAGDSSVRSASAG